MIYQFVIKKIVAVIFLNDFYFYGLSISLVQVTNRYSLANEYNLYSSPTSIIIPFFFPPLKK